MSETPHNSCDECGKKVDKIWRVHKGSRYCGTCYARVFKKRFCPKCGNVARLPKNDPPAICRRCEVSKPCVRCGKTEYKVGKITPYGPACSACAAHFREPEPCDECGTPSPRLTRVSRFGHDRRLCPKCASSDYSNCAACGRRALLAVAPDGSNLCRTCREKGEVPCPECGKQMPAGRGKMCESCYWTVTCRKRLRMDLTAFSIGDMGSAFGEFGEWLIGAAGPHKAALSINRYLTFFLEIEKHWGRTPTYNELLGRFGAEGLRRVRLPMRWFGTARGIEPDPAARDADSERRQIAAILDSIPEGTHCRRTLAAYKERLAARHDSGKLSLRSLRLALRAAASLLRAADSCGVAQLDQAVLDRYLLDVPGQKAAVTGFVNFLNEENKLGLVPKVDQKRVDRARRKKLEKELAVLIWENGEGDGIKRKLLSAALAYFHGLPREAGQSVADQAIQDSGDDGITVLLDGKSYWVPPLRKK